MILKKCNYTKNCLTKGWLVGYTAFIQEKNKIIHKKGLKMEKAKKFNNISLLRVIAILAIFSFHLLQPLSTTQGRQYFPMAFGVEIFLFISGFLYAFKEIVSYKEFFKKNFIKILWPTFLFILICLATGGVFSLLTKTDFVQFFHYTSVTGELLYNHGHLWYIVAILLCYLSLPVL